MNLEQFKNATVGYKIGFGFHEGYGYGGECGELASYWLSELTNNKFQMAYGKPNINAEWCIGSDCRTAWNVAYQSNWGAMGFEKIDNPTFSQLKPGDIFFISPRGSLTTGHVGVVYSVANNNVTTIEQNFNGARYTQLMPGANSWSYYGGFTCVVRPKQNKPQPPKEETNTTETQEGANIDMILYQIYDKTGAHKGKWYVSNGTHLRYIRTPRVLKKYQELKLPVDVIYSSELFKDFPEKTIL